MTATAGSSCSDSTAPDEILALSVTPSDTVLFAGESATFNALAEYEWGAYPADTVAWSVSDIGVLRILEVEDATAMVTVDARGEAFLIATLGELVDSARVIAVEPGDLRWRVEVGGDGGLALDEAGRIYVADLGGGGRLTAATEEGQIVFSVPSGWSFLSPSVTSEGYSYVTSGLGTTGFRAERRSRDGTLEWTVPFGNFDGGPAVASDGSVVIVDVIREGEFPTVVTKISPEGVEIWRDTLALTPDMDAQSSAPAIATNGDIYVPWAEQIFGPNWLSRVSADGALAWTVAGTGWAFSTSPALTGDRVIVTGRGGNLEVYDTTGALLWRRSWQGSVEGVSSPVVDAEGNIYVQSQKALVSYDPMGELRWSADSLGCGGCGMQGVAAPTLLTSGQLVVPCGRAVCAVAADGSLDWRTLTGGVPTGCPAVGVDGTIYVGVGQQLIALWGQAPPLTEGWPTEGGGMGRLRHRN